ncbi:hypothetical protein ACEQPO_29995 [Bacillus sp. SL00103]
MVKLASSVHELSGGQKQHVAIAGVLVNKSTFCCSTNHLQALILQQVKK